MNIFIVAVLVMETARDQSEICEPEALVQIDDMRVRGDNSVKLQDAGNLQHCRRVKAVNKDTLRYRSGIISRYIRVVLND